MTRKIAVSAILFAVIVILGGVLNHQLMERRAAEFEQSAGYYSIYSATYEKNAADRLHPFGSREYVRIIRREEQP